MANGKPVRPSSGITEEVSLLGLFITGGAYLASLVDGWAGGPDPNRTTLIVGACTILGQVVMKLVKTHLLKNTIGGAAAAKLTGVSLMLIVLLSLGCVTNPDGERKVDRAQCEATVEKLEAGVIACNLMPGETEDDLRNRNICIQGAQIALAAARIGCSFADEHGVPPA